MKSLDIRIIKIDLSGKTAIVTGSTGGIGLAIALDQMGGLGRERTVSEKHFPQKFPNKPQKKQIFTQ